LAAAGKILFATFFLYSGLNHISYYPVKFKQAEHVLFFCHCVRFGPWKANKTGKWQKVLSAGQKHW